MLDTVLNLGLTDASVIGLASETGNARFAWDSYRRLVQMLGSVSRGIPSELFEAAITEAKARRGVTEDTELDAEALRELTGVFKEIYRQRTGEEFSQDPREQLSIA